MSDLLRIGIHERAKKKQQQPNKRNTGGGVGMVFVCNEGTVDILFPFSQGKSRNVSKRPVVKVRVKTKRMNMTG